MAIAEAPRGVKTTWKIDPSHSLVEFAVKHMMISTVKGRFEGVSGTIETIDENIGDASIDVEIDAATIDTRAAQRDAHLKSADFLDVERFPKITFKSTRIEDHGDGTFDVIGELTIREVSKELTLHCTDNGRGNTPFGTYIAAFTGETSFNRHDFGAKWNVALETGGFLVGDEVKVSLEIEAVKEQAS
ncbi:MAG TPA: YceI family protein [Chloroflexota bacterium]|nr:YceI family protein [Chloroflexota bacterium]